MQDWQQAHASLESQLALALHTNEQHTRLLAQQRGEIEQLRTRVYAAEQRALEAEAELRARASGAEEPAK